MYSLRTTEKSLSLLRKISKPKSKKTGYFTPRQIHQNTSIQAPKKSINPNNVVPKQEQQFVPLLNPNKPEPSKLTQRATKPMVPLTLPRFPKGQTSPSVTKVLSDTMPASSRFMLERWKESMIKKLGAAGFAQYQADTFERGRALHAVIANHLLKQGCSSEHMTKEVVQKLWTSIEKVVQDKISNVRLVEHIVTHPAMNYRGIVDCVATYEDELVVIDFKTAEKPKNSVTSLFDNPLQVTAYCGAINNDPNIPIDVIDRNIASGLVIVAYMDGSEASVHYLNSEEYWKKWLIRLDQYKRLDLFR